MNIRLNGKQESIDEPGTLMSLVQDRGYNVEVIVIEYNGEVIPKDNWDSICLSDQDQLEIVSFVGGG